MNQKIAAVQYRFSPFALAFDHVIEIEASFDARSRNELDLFMPVWTPGSYLIREYARNIESIAVVDQPTDITLSKVSKNHWHLSWKQSREWVSIRYRLYAREKSVRTNWIDPEFAFLTGAATFITSRTFLDQTHRLSICELGNDSSFDCALTSMEVTQSNCIELLATSYDELVDSPILIGKLDVKSFGVAGKKHRFVNAGFTDRWNIETATNHTAKIVQTVQNFWGEVPYEEYSFQNLAIGGYGGLEHDNCTVLMTEPHTMLDRTQYVDWLGLVCHEFFHTWNVRRLRPKALIEYDYDNEQYVKELWIAEGITSYYDDLLVYRSGLCNEAEYLSRLSKTIQSVMNAPGRLVQSLVDSSLDTWIKHYRPDENSNNSRISYYTKGAIVAWLLDVRIRQLIDDARSLDDVMRALWQRHRETGYTIEDFESLVIELVPASWQSWFDLHVRSTDELSFDDALAMLGLRWKSTTFESRCLEDVATCVPLEGAVDCKPAVTTLGCETKDVNGRVYVAKLIRTSRPGVGLQVDDEIIAINGKRVTSSTMTATLGCQSTDVDCEVLISRRDRTRTIVMKLAPSPSEWKLEIDPNASLEASLRRNRWLTGS
jgi:predicted metalloprotease with PDZ domain